METKLKFFLFLLLTVLISSLRMRSKTGCIDFNGDCDLTSYCCGSNVCKDYRCAKKGTKDNQVEWAPKGEKCDYFHHCKKFYKCESHRCVLNTNKIINNVKKKLNGDF
jgi:hypothetical protein